MSAERSEAASLSEYLSDTVNLDLPPPQDSDAAAELAYRIYQESGRQGATVSLYFGSLLNQPLFSVGLLPDLFPLPEPGRAVNLKDLTAFVRGNQELLKQPSHGVGLWYDAEDDQVFMDIVILVSGEEEAGALGAEYNQKSMFDLKAGEVIWLGGTGEPIE